MRLQTLTLAQALDSVAELRAMAQAEPGPNPALLRRANEIRFLLQGQPRAREYFVEKAALVYGSLEVLFSARRWRQATSLAALRKDIKSGCQRLQVAVRDHFASAETA